MALQTAHEYLDSLRALRRKVFIFGKKVAHPVDHPLVRPSTNAVALTYALAGRPEHRDLMTAVSHLTGERVNRFTHIHQSTADLVAKSKMGRFLGAHTGCCFQRCVGMDALNALSIVTFDLDAAHGTAYHQRFRRYLAQVQARDLVCDGAMTDPKGDRALPPHRQADPDLYLRVVEERAEGIVVRGAKIHQTGALNSHEIIVMPTRKLQEADRAYAVAFAVPADAPGLTFILGRQSCDTRKLEGGRLDQGNPFFGGHEAMIVFEDVFVPWERVFMHGEVDFSGDLVEHFASYHRQSYACKVGVGDVLIGAAGAVAQYNGAAAASHVKDKLVEMTHLNETLYCGCIACASEGRATASGTFLVDPLLANVHKQNVTRFPFEIARLAQDLAGGLMVTMPSQPDLEAEATGPLVRKYLAGPSTVPVEDRLRMLRLIENLTLGSAAVSYLTESLHGAGSPQAQRIMIARLADMEQKQGLARRLCGIEPLELDFLEAAAAGPAAHGD